MDANTEQPHPTTTGHEKTLHLVRHAQGIHNVEADRDEVLSDSDIQRRNAALLKEASATLQAGILRKRIHDSGLFKKIELVVTSPLSRAMQTALELFGMPQSKDAKAEDGGLKCPPFVAVELCRECVGVHPCDKRRTVNELQSVFPTVDFSLIETEDDIMWKDDVRETKEDVAARGQKFMNWLWSRPEEVIAVVTHNRFLEHTLNGLGNVIDPSIKTEACKGFKNCELRSLAMVGRRQDPPGETAPTSDSQLEYKLCGVPQELSEDLSVSSA